MPDAICGPWVSNEVLFGADKARSNSAEAMAIAVVSKKGNRNNLVGCKLRFAVRRAWKQWGICWFRFHQPMDYSEHANYQDVWDTRANIVKKECAEFVRLHGVACGTTEGLYLHILHAHAHEQIRKWGDLRVRQTQGLEHAHKIRKQIGLMATNRKPGQRLKTMLTYKMVLQDLKRWQSSDLIVHMHEKNKAKLLVRLHAKLKRTNEGLPIMDALSDALTPY
jgi:hypothetical protein